MLRQFGRALRQPRVVGSQITRATVLTACSTLTIASLLLVLFQFFNLRASLAEDLRALARISGAGAADALRADGGPAAATAALAWLADAGTVRSATLYDGVGRPLAHFLRPGATAAPRQTGMVGVSYAAGYLEVAEPVGRDAAATLVLQADLQPLYRRLAGYAALVLAIALCIFALAWRRIGAAQQVESRLHFLAHVDPVTALPNRHEFNASLAFALARADRQESQVGLLLLDLDNFKLVNDTLGHNAGDLLLKLVAERLVGLLRASDIICRIGGDEFVFIVQPSDGLAETASVARKILDGLTLPFTVDSHQLHVSASIGVSLYPSDARDAQTLIRTADTAMYQAKHGGKGRFAVFQPQMESHGRRYLQIEAALRRAVALDQLELYYQPQIDLATGRMVGMEVLTRWHCPDLGIVDPSDFIPVAEESGAIVPLGRWVLQQACRQAAIWHAAGLLDQIGSIAVNLSASQSRDAGLLEDIGALLDETGLPPRLLELELTESILMDNAEANLALMQRLRDAGLRLSVDDFGTGYSSMSYLQRFPLTKLKIDRSFVRDVPGDGAAIATAIIAMAHSLDMVVVAEGVETARQAQFLREAGCDSVQGFFFARPMPAMQLGLLLRERRVWRGAQALA